MGRQAREEAGRITSPQTDDPDDTTTDTATEDADNAQPRAGEIARNSWHVGADWTEAFAPVIYDNIDSKLREIAGNERSRLDALIAAGKPLARPQVWLCDDIPVYGQALDGDRSRRDTGFAVLVIAELHYPANRHPDTRIRLVRALPNTTAEAWRLCFDELGYHPDFVVADAASGLLRAVDQHFDPARTRFVPSMWHMQRSIRRALASTRGALVAGPSGPEPPSDVLKHLSQLRRGSPALSNSTSWTRWWNTLENLIVGHSLPVDGIRSRRRLYQARMASILKPLKANPTVPVSTGGLETLIRRQVAPLLAGRRTAFANLERTNRLFDLVVARHHGAFRRLTDVTRLIQQDGLAHEGHTVALRQIADPRAADGTAYSSLRDRALLADLAEERGLT